MEGARYGTGDSRPFVCEFLGLSVPSGDTAPYSIIRRSLYGKHF